ncbi:ABC transporter ATP-binding protein [Oligoflexaceae bacterium]|nr:ABC transporter ATP-binding protein [Oligoflexaceae bacterium]
MTESILEIRDLVTAFTTERGVVRAISGVDLDVQAGKTLGIVGESGCGKSVTALSIMRLLPKPAGFIESGSILFKGMDLATLPPAEMLKVRGNRIAMIFQEPMTALNPVYKIGRQITEVMSLHRSELSAEQMRKEAVEVLAAVGIPAPDQRIDEYPHQLSGGMRQRVMIAMALACKPDVLIADEPTTALDVTIQAQILELMRDLQKEYGMSIIFITHDLGVVAETCHDVAVMYAGRIVERGSAEDLFAHPAHPYTRGLLASIPKPDTPRKSRLPTIEGMVPSLFELPEGCRFQGRCDFVQDKCRKTQPQFSEVNGHQARCFALEADWKGARIE